MPDLFSCARTCWRSCRQKGARQTGQARALPSVSWYRVTHARQKAWPQRRSRTGDVTASRHTAQSARPRSRVTGGRSEVKALGSRVTALGSGVKVLESGVQYLGSRVTRGRKVLRVEWFRVNKPALTPVVDAVEM